MSKMERPIPPGARFNGPLTKADMQRAQKSAPDAEIVPEPAVPTAAPGEVLGGNALVPTDTNEKAQGDVADEAEPFDAETHKDRFTEGYYELAKAIRDDGNEPNDLQSWKEAVALRREMAIAVAEFNRTRVVASESRTRGEQARERAAQKIKQLSARFQDDVVPAVAAESRELRTEREKHMAPPLLAPQESSPIPVANNAAEELTSSEARTALRENVEKMRKLMEESGMRTMEDELPSGGENLAPTPGENLKQALSTAGEHTMEPDFGEFERPAAGTPQEKLARDLAVAGETSMEPHLSHEAGWYDAGEKREAPKADRLAESVAFLAQRSKELNSRAENLGEVPKDFIHRQGDRYNKIPLAWKIAMGVALGGTAAGFMTVSPVVVGIASLGLGLQRVAGFAGIYAKVEQHLLDTKEKKKVAGLSALSAYRRLAEAPAGQRKLAAAVMAGAWTLGMSAAIGEAVHVASESSWGDAVHEWLRNHWPTTHAHAPVTHTPEAPPAVHPEVVPQSPAPVETLATVHATPGHGYEYMLKRLSEQLQAQHIDVSHLDPTSDAYKLATASPHDIDTLVHQMASDPTHNFFRGPDGSVRIGLNADLSVNSDGSIEFNDGSGHMYVQAPSDAPLTPNVTHAAASAHADSAPSEAQVQQTAERLRLWHAANPNMPDMVPQVDAAGDVYGPPGAHTVDPSWSFESHGASAPHTLETFTNPHGIEVNLAQPHVYTLEGGGVVVDGGTYDERLQVAIGYVQQHGGSVQVEAKAPVRVNGVLTRYLETVKKAGPFGLSGHIETSTLAGAPRPADVLSESPERFATRFIKKLQ